MSITTSPITGEITRAITGPLVLDETGGPGVGVDNLLLESGDDLLLESGDLILLE